MNKNAKTMGFFFIFIVGVMGIAFGAEYFNNNDSLDEGDESTNWATDPYRLGLDEIVMNLTLNVDFGNGTTFTFENIILTDHYTTVYDLLNEKCDVGIKKYYVSDNILFYITSINSLKENIQSVPQVSWIYSVNGINIMAAANRCPLENNDIVEWEYYDGDEIF